MATGFNTQVGNGEYRLLGAVFEIQKPKRGNIEKIWLHIGSEI